MFLDLGRVSEDTSSCAHEKKKKKEKLYTHEKQEEKDKLAAPELWLSACLQGKHKVMGSNPNIGRGKRVVD